MICARQGTISGEAYLTGFELARDEHRYSSGTETGSWEDKIYRYPDRQAEQGNPHFVPAYDIYSLGVVLIEIARWRTCASEMDKDGKEVFSEKSPEDCRKHILRKFLPGVVHHAGQTYADVVRDCLNAERGQGIQLMGDVLSRLERLQDSI